MVDMNTFLTALYVMVDEFCKSRLPAEKRPGPTASLCRSEVVTLAILSQWYRFRNERDFYRMAEKRLRSAFPTLPHRTQFNRLARRHREATVAFSLYLVELMQARKVAYEILDTTGVPVRNVKRRGNSWLAGEANIGWCTRLGWFYGFRLLISVTPDGVITGFGFAEGSAKEQPMTETMLALRNQGRPAIASVGKPALGYYVADQGFAGDKTHKEWRILYDGDVISEPQSNSKTIWPKRLRRWLHSIRQLVETALSWQMDFFRLDKIRSHDITGFHACLAAKVALHNFCIWLNKQAGRPPLAFADLLDW
jgi:hypothetical protein